ncbi:TerY-C metal binding domain-containing protein [Spirosoma lituiforme]
MVGDPIDRVQDGIATIIRDLRTDPYALETVYVSMLIFANKARRLVPLIEISQFYPPRLPIGSGTSLGAALYLLMDELDKQTVRTSAQTKGDWKPLVFLLTDGVPTDNYSSALDEWKARFKARVNLIAVSFGNSADTNVLQELTEHVYRFEDTDPAAYAQFFRWISQSVKSSSIAIDQGQGDGINLAKASDELLQKVDVKTIQPRASVDDRYAVLLAKCQTTQKPYLVKYEQTHRSPDAWLGELNLQTREYRLLGAYGVDQDYFELSNDQESAASVDTNELVGFPHCPHCANPYGFSLCICGKLFCSGEESIARCPWCENQMQMSAGDRNTTINRTAG